MTNPKEIRLKVLIPYPGQWDGAMVMDEATGREIPCRSLKLEIDAETRLPVITLVIPPGNWGHCFEVAGTFRCEMVKEDQPENV